MVRLTDHPDMTLDVYCGRKTTMQQQQPVTGTAGGGGIIVVLHTQFSSDCASTKTYLVTPH